MAVYAFYESFLSVFMTITHSGQLMPRLHVFVINLTSSGKSLAAAAS